MSVRGGGTPGLEAWKGIPPLVAVSALALLAAAPGGLRAGPDVAGTSANVIVVLDSSGSMRETLDTQDSADPLPLVDQPDEGEVVGDDPTSKLAQAKRVLSEVIKTSPEGVRFHLGKYGQSAAPKDFGPTPGDRFLYATTDPLAAGIYVNLNGDGSAPPGVKRSARDQRTVGGVTTYYLFAGRFWNGQRIQVLSDGSQARVVSSAAGSNPAFLELQRKSRSGQPMSPPVRFSLKGIRWNKANRQEDPADRPAVLMNNASCGGFAPLTSDAAEMDRYLAPELKIKDDGSIDGYEEGPLGAPPTSPPREYGIRASGLTPLAGTLIDIRKRLGSSWSGLLEAKTFVILVTDGDDTCLDELTGDVSVSRADDRALRAAHKAQLLLQGTKVPVFVVTFGRDVSARRSQWIAWGGSGMVRESTGVGDAARWASAPAEADRGACKTCRDAITAADAAELSAGLRKAVEAGLNGSGR